MKKILQKAYIGLLLSLFTVTYVSGQNRYSFSELNIKRHITFLGSDLLEGRGAGSNGIDLAARYLALELSRLNIKPLGDNNTYYQNIPMFGIRTQDNTELKIMSTNAEHKLIYKKDFLLYESGNQIFFPKPMELVFVGYGIIAPEFDYNDYQSVNVEGKIVVALEGEPISENPSYFDGENTTVYSFPTYKLRQAIAKGANGLIIISANEEWNDQKWEKKVLDFSFEHVVLASKPSNSLSLLIRDESANVLFKESKYSLQEVLAMHKSETMNSFDLVSKIFFKGSFAERSFISSNVIGIIEGTDSRLKDSYIILSAHYDHLGIGKPVEGDSIYNGVLDNALGVSGLLEIASLLSELNINKRSIIILFTTGEENGLLGSSFYTSHPKAPLYKTIANINIDGIPYIDMFRSVIGVGGEYSELGEILRAVSSRNEISVEKINKLLMSYAFSKSDQLAFANAGIPSILIVNGYEAVNLTREELIAETNHFFSNIYHTPFDDLSQKIDYNAVKQYLNLIVEFLLEVDKSASVPEWYSGIPYLNIQLRNKAEKK